MWPLIIPPIVFVLSLGFLVWFLSKKGPGPKDLELMEQGSGRTSLRRPLFFTEEMGWRLLERLTQRLKLASLKFHNRFQEFSHWIRRRREQVTEGEAQPVESAVADIETEDKEGFWDRWHRRHRANLEPMEPVTPAQAVSREPISPDGERVSITAIPAPTPEPTSRFGGLRKKIDHLTSSSSTEYFTRHERVAAVTKKFLSEEELIDRIAKNPKDAASYEELGDYYMASENLEDAKACYRQVIKLSPLNREVKDKVRKLERLLVQRERLKH